MKINHKLTLGPSRLSDERKKEFPPQSNTKPLSPYPFTGPSFCLIPGEVRYMPDLCRTWVGYGTAMLRRLYTSKLQD